MPQVATSQRTVYMCSFCAGSAYIINIVMNSNVCTTGTEAEPRHLWQDSVCSEASSVEDRTLACNNNSY